MWDWIENALKAAKAALGFPDTPEPVTPCPKKETGLIVVVVRKDNNKPVQGANVTVTGPTPGADTTNADGLTKFKPVTEGSYKIDATVPPSEKDEYDPPTPGQEGVALGAVSTHILYITPLVNIVTPVITLEREELKGKAPSAADPATEIHYFDPEKKEDEEEKPDVVEVKLTYKETRPAIAYDKGGTFTAAAGSVTVWEDKACKTPVVLPLRVRNSQLKAGHTVYLRGDASGEAALTLTLDQTQKERITLEGPVNSNVKVKPAIRVTPHIRVEHLVVLRDQELWKEQRKDDTQAGSAAIDAPLQIRPDPTRIELHATKTADDPAYTGKGTLSFTPANVKAFTDEECKTEFNLSEKIEFAKLTGAESMKLWLRGVTAGKFTAKLELEASTDEKIKVDGPAKGEMGCVELKLKLHHYKKDEVNKAVEPDVADATTYWDEMKGLTFEQAEMTKAERIGTGRMIHVQKDKYHSRAKLIFEKVDASQWPDKASTYKLTLACADSDKPNKVRTGNLKIWTLEDDGDEKATCEIPLADAKAAEKTFWIEGAAACEKWRGIRLSAGFDRPDGDLTKTAKMDGDWGAFTVIKIKEVKCDVANEAGQEAFVDGSKVFINLDDKGRLLKTVAGKRKADVTCEIEPALKDVDLYFSVVEHADNFKFDKLPADFKEKKVAKLKNTLKAVDKDDRKKLLHMTVKTDEHGKAKIEKLKMPQLAKSKFKIGTYILQDPQHARFIDEHADLKKRMPVLSSTWLEVWNRFFYKVAAVKRWSGASYIDRFDSGALEGKMADVGIELKADGAAVTTDYHPATPNFLTWARTNLGGVAPKRTMYLGLISGRGDKADEDGEWDLGAPTVKTPVWNLNYKRFRDVATPATWLTSCEVEYDGTTHDIAGVTTLTQIADFTFRLTINFNALWNQIKASDDEATADDMLATGAIKLKYKEADSSSGVSWHEAVVVCMDTREPDHAVENAKDSATHTFLHEIGHYAGLAGKFLPDETNTLNPNFYSELAGEVSAAGKGGYGLGPHCDGLADQCIMWYQFKMTLEYCDACKLFLRARDMHNPKVDGRATL